MGCGQREETASVLQRQAGRGGCWERSKEGERGHGGERVRKGWGEMGSPHDCVFLHGRKRGGLIVAIANVRAAEVLRVQCPHTVFFRIYIFHKFFRDPLVYMIYNILCTKINLSLHPQSFCPPHLNL